MRVISTALGCDGVLADFAAGVLQVVEAVTGRKFNLPDTLSPLALNFFKILDLTDDEVIAVKEELGARRGFVLALRPYAGARQGIRRLRKLGEVFCVSTAWEPSSSWGLAERESWLALHFGIDRVHHVVEAAKAWCEADIFVDARASRVQEWLSRWPDRTAVLWSAPHNIRETVPSGAHSTDSWEDLYEIALGVARSATPQRSPMADGGVS